MLYKRPFLTFIIGGLGYCLLEVLWRGYTHLSMAVVGGICFMGIGYINARFKKQRILKRAFLCSFFITAIELISGIILNIVFNMNVWDYSSLPFNLMGQICLYYWVLWFLLCIVIAKASDKFYTVWGQSPNGIKRD